LSEIKQTRKQKRLDNNKHL